MKGAIMTEKEMIEEMTKKISNARNTYFRTNINMGKYHYYLPTEYKELLKHYQPKLPEISVVLSQNEYEELNITGKYFNDALKQSRKETAKEILFKVESAFAYYDNEDMFSKKAILERVEEIAKQYGVEV